MLVLSRKASEQILIGKNITITVVRVQGQKVRIGIDAPADIHVVRGEIADKPRVAKTGFSRTAGVAVSSHQTSRDGEPCPAEDGASEDSASYQLGSSRRVPDARRTPWTSTQPRLGPATSIGGAGQLSVR